MPRLSYSQIAALIESDPVGVEALRMVGYTPAQAAASLYRAVTDAQASGNTREADRILSTGARLFGVNTAGVSEWQRGTDALLTVAGDTSAGIRKAAERMSEESRASGMYSAPDRIERLIHEGRNSAMRQGLADRLRTKDAHVTKHQGDSAAPPSERARADADDTRDRRAALRAAFASTEPDEVLRLGREYGEPSESRHAMNVGLRDTVAAAFDAHEAREAERDPLDDPRLASMSDAV